MSIQMSLKHCEKETCTCGQKEVTITLPNQFHDVDKATVAFGKEAVQSVFESGARVRAQQKLRKKGDPKNWTQSAVQSLVSGIKLEKGERKKLSTAEKLSRHHDLSDESQIAMMELVISENKFKLYRDKFKITDFSDAKAKREAEATLKALEADYEAKRKAVHEA